MLYQTLQFTYPQPYNQFVLPPGVLGILPITVASNQVILLKMNQLLGNPHHLPQDRSIRALLSTQIGGGNVNVSHPGGWTLTALQKTIVWVYDVTSGLGPFGGINLAVNPGNYWLNVLNLVNETNSFHLEICDPEGV